MGNDGVSIVIGVGDGCLQTNMGMMLLFKGVKHAHDVNFNLFYVQMIDDVVIIITLVLKSGNPPMIVARGENSTKLYMTKALVAKDTMNVMDMEASLWQRRLSHIS